MMPLSRLCRRLVPNGTVLRAAFRRLLPSYGERPDPQNAQKPDFRMALTANKYRTAPYSPTSLLPAVPSSR